VRGRSDEESWCWEPVRLLHLGGLVAAHGHVGVVIILFVLGVGVELLPQQPDPRGIITLAQSAFKRSCWCWSSTHRPMLELDGPCAL